MIYADFAYYTGVYCGTMAEGDFLRLARAATAHIDALTFGRAASVTDAGTKAKLQDACCAVADVLLAEERGGEVASETVGKWSRTYATSGKSFAQRCYDAVALYLANTGLLYSGCRL